MAKSEFSAHHVSAVGPTQETIGVFLAEARKAAGMTQQDVAFAMQNDKQTISDWENGRYRMTAEDFLKLILLYRADILKLLAVKLPSTKGAGAGAGEPGRTRRTG